MPAIITRGAASAKGFGFAGKTGPAVYIEDVFSTYLYTGNGTIRTITNGIDLSTKGGLVWIKNRSDAYSHKLTTTNTPAYALNSDSTSALAAEPNGLTAFTSSGFTIGVDGSFNFSGNNFVSWTFRKQPKFFDVTTFTTDGSGSATVSHNLGAVPACVMIKNTGAGESWMVYHTSLGDTNRLVLNSTAAPNVTASWISVSSTTVTFNGVWTSASANYVMYVFASNAGGFGLAGTDNGISCGTFTTDGSGGFSVNLGYEPQWVIIKSSGGLGGWFMLDNMRGLAATGTNGTDQRLYANTSGAEASDGVAYPTSTGFGAVNALVASTAHIYIAIRRGPMKVPTVGTSVFGLSATAGTGANATVTGGQTDDAVLIKNRGSAVASLFSSRLTYTGYLVTSSTAAEVAAGVTILQANPWDVMDGVKVGTTSTITNASANTFINYLFKRAPSFFDVVCYTGTGVDQSISHNLSVQPTLLIIKRRTGAVVDWNVAYNVPIGNDNLCLNLTVAAGASQTYTNGYGAGTSSSVFQVIGATTSDAVNASGSTYVAYLFATCAGVSKVGSYTGNGSSQTIACGFTAGSRFVMIKRTSSTGDWYVWDSARGIVAGNDPHLSLNTTAAEVTTDDSVDTDNSGFIVNQDAATNVNVTSATYIFLAIA